MNNIEEVLKKLKDKGIDEGKSEAQRIVAEAEEKARKIIENAEKKVKQIEEETDKKIKEQESAAKSAMETAGKNVINNTTVKITEILEKILTAKIKEAFNKDETIKKILNGKKVSAEEIIPFIREVSIKDGFEIEMKNGKILVKWKDENYHFEISEEMMLEEIKGNIREELHNYIFKSGI